MCLSSHLYGFCFSHSPCPQMKLRTQQPLASSSSTLATGSSEESAGLTSQSLATLLACNLEDTRWASLLGFASPTPPLTSHLTVFSGPWVEGGEMSFVVAWFSSRACAGFKHSVWPPPHCGVSFPSGYLQLLSLKVDAASPLWPSFLSPLSSHVSPSSLLWCLES